MRRQPLLIMLLCFAAAIAVRDKFTVDFRLALMILLSGTALLLTLFGKNFWFQKFRSYFVGAFFFAVGFFCHHLNSEKLKIPDFEGKQKFVFRIDTKLYSNQKYRRYETEILMVNEQDKDFVPFKAVISVPKEIPPLDFRNYYQTEAYINAIASPDNDFQFNYARYSARKDIYRQAFINAEVLAAPKKELNFADRFNQKRLDILQRIDGSSLSSTSKAFLKGIILADRTDMDAQTVSDFSRSGLMHFLAISGSHMAIIFFMLMWLLKPIFPAKYRNYPILISLILIWMFAWFIGFGSSVTRSCIMVTAYYLFVILDRKPDFLHAMALAGFIILAFDSHQLFDVGFQLSFLAVAGIFWLNRPILNLFGRVDSRWKRFLANIVSMSLSAQIATLPLVLYYFHQYSAVSVIANLVIIPFSEIIIIFSLLMTVLFAFGFELVFLSNVYEFIVSVLLKTIHWFAVVDFGTFTNVPMSLAEVMLFLLAAYFLRDVLVRKDLSSILRFTLLVILFFALRFGLDLRSFRNDEVVVTHYFRDKVLLVKHRNAVDVFAAPKIKSEKLQKYIVDPYLASRRAENSTVINVPKETPAVVVNGKTFSLK